GESLFQDLVAFILSTIAILEYPIIYAFAILMGGLKKLFLRRMVVLIAIVCFATCISHWIQIGFLFSTETLIPSFQKINPINNLSNLFSMRHFVEFGKSFLKLSLVSCVFYYVLSHYVQT